MQTKHCKRVQDLGSTHLRLIVRPDPGATSLREVGKQAKHQKLHHYPKHNLENPHYHTAFNALGRWQLHSSSWTCLRRVPAALMAKGERGLPAGEANLLYLLGFYAPYSAERGLGLHELVQKNNHMPPHTRAEGPMY